MSDLPNSEPKKLSSLIERHFKAGDLRSALDVCQQLNQRFDGYHHGWYLASFLMMQVNNSRDALRAIEKALAIFPSDKYYLQKAQCLVALNDISGAKKIAKQLLSVSFLNADLHHDLGMLFERLGQYPEALSEFNKAIAIDPIPAEYHFNKAAIQRYLGDVIGANDSFGKAIELNPTDYEAYLSRSNLNRQKPEDNNIGQIKSAINRAENSEPNKTDSHPLYYALAKELEDLERYNESFNALQTASQKKRQKMQYSVKTDLDIIEGIRNVFTKEIFDSEVGELGADAPIFILGMPRSGTTLVERILDSHSEVSSAGELNNFSQEMMRQVKSSGVAIKSRLDLIAKTKNLNFLELGKSYVESVRPLVNDSHYFIDKLPFNYLYAGLIHLAMPNAKIINLQRSPMDTCYAVYKQLFKDAYPFSYDLEELGHYFVAYQQLMDHWNTVMPGVIYSLSYERLVTDVESETRKLVSHCGLTWQDQCLRFYDNTAASTTASASQVRLPAYTSSIGRWRHYESQLQPILSIFERTGIATD